MQTLTTGREIQKLFDDISFEYLIETMQRDIIEFYNKIDGNENEWISRVLIIKGYRHKGSTTSNGFLLRYQFRRIFIGFDVGIREIKVSESMDEFLDLYNEVYNNSKLFNLEYYGK